MTTAFLAPKDLADAAIRRRVADLRSRGFSFFPGAVIGSVPSAALAGFQAYWDDLPLDEELADGGSYRCRRYGRLLADLSGDHPTLTPLPHAAFRQDASHIPIYHGRARTFAPAAEESLLHPVMCTLVAFDAAVAAGLDDNPVWVVNLHLVRVVARSGLPGLPTPEGRHRDGHAYVAMHLLRRACGGGESVVYTDGAEPTRLTLQRPLDSLMVDDDAVMHEVTPVSAPSSGDGIRDMLLVDLNPQPAG